MNTTYFHNVETLEDLRQQFKKLAMQHHPDRGGSTEIMQAINAEYEKLLSLIGNKRRTADGKTYEKTNFNPAKDHFREIIEKLLKMQITIEICGIWLWVSDAYSYREELKKIGFFWASKKKKWAWSEEPTTGNRHLTMEEIRHTYGSEIIRNTENLLTATA